MNQQKFWNNEYKRKKTWNRETCSLPDTLKNKSVLELGVGNGKTLHSILKQHPKKVTAIDFSSEAIKICNEKFKDKNIIFKEVDITNLPFTGNSFDIVVCYYVLDNLLENERKKAIIEIKRVLKDKGLLLFEDLSVGDFRQEKQKQHKEMHTTIKSSGLICHYFTEQELNSLLNIFSSSIVALEIKQYIKGKQFQRKIIKAQAIK